MPLQIESFEAYRSAQKKSKHNPEQFWAEIANHFDWQRPFKEVHSGKMEDASTRWFGDGQINITENALDRNLRERGDQIALHWEPNDPNSEGQSFTYSELHRTVSQFGNAMRAMGVKKGERVVLYMPMVPELAIAVLGLRPHRRRTFGGVRRVQRTGLIGSDRRRSSLDGHYGQCGQTRGKNHSFESDRRRGAERKSIRSECDCKISHFRSMLHGFIPGCLVERRFEQLRSACPVLG